MDNWERITEKFEENASEVLLLAIGQEWTRRGYYEKAEARYLAALKMNPNNEVTHLLMGDANEKSDSIECNTFLPRSF